MGRKYTFDELDKCSKQLNDLNPYYYFKYLLEEIPKYMGEKGNVEASNLEALLPWSERLS